MGRDTSHHLRTVVAWEVYFECGASHIEADLRDLLLKHFWLKSSASKLDLQLPPPTGTVPIQLESGLSSLRLMRPIHVPVRLEFQGDWAPLRFDGKKISAGDGVLESPNYARAKDRYLIRFVGSGSKVIVEEKK